MFLDYSLKIKSIDEQGIFAGYASVFNVVDEMQDAMLPGAFQGNLQIGKILDIREDNSGLYVKAQLILDIRQAQEAYFLLKSGVINGLSIGYVPLAHTTEVETGIRRITKVDLWEVSLVTFPANRFATVTSYKSSHLLANRAYNALRRLIN